MKKILLCSAVLMAVSFYPHTLHAQFLKNMVGSINQTIQNKKDYTNSKAAHNNDSAAQLTLANTIMQAADTTPLNKVLDAFTKAAKDNPNDTSSADLTMKALGNLIGGGGVSPADSATAIKSFTTASGGNGFYYETVTNVASKQTGTNNDTSINYFTTSGEGRSEMDLPGMMGIKGGNKLVTLSHANQKRYSLTLVASNKTYSLTLIDTSLINSRNESYRVTKIGNETINGFNCIHSKLISTSGYGMFKSSSTMDIWTSPDVAGYSLLKKVMTMRNVTPKMMQTMEQAGCSGYFVKINMQNKDFTMNMVLIKSEAKNLPAAMFRIPAGYTESNDNMFMHMTGAKK